MASIKFATWNAEWLNELFTGNPPVFHDYDTRGYMTRFKTGDRRNDINGVINDVSADIWVIVEGPNQTAELQLFFDQDEIDGTWECAVQPSGAQSIGLAVRMDTGKFESVDWHDLESDPVADKLKKATNEFRMDTDRDGLYEIHKFERKPLYASVTTTDSKKFRVIGLHLKSKGVFDSLEWSRWWSKADGNRKKLIAQCHQLRTEFIDEYLTEDGTKDIPLIVCGDVNDGPGFDTSEMKIQTSGIERLMGTIWAPQLCLGNALFDTLDEKDKKTLDFSSLDTAFFSDPIFNNVKHTPWIDHILYSHRHNGWISEGTIHDETQDGKKWHKAFPKASDHNPVSCIVDLDSF